MAHELVDPQKELVQQYYRDYMSDTFGNAYQSALRAGIPEVQARKITAMRPEWFKEQDDIDIENIRLTERNINRYLRYDRDLNEVDNKFTLELLKMQHDMTKFVAKSVMKRKYGGDDSNGEKGNVQINIVNYSDKSEPIIDVEPK